MAHYSSTPLFLSVQWERGDSFRSSWPAVPLSYPCVLWWEAAPLWAATNALSPSSPARRDLTLNPNAPMKIIFMQFYKKNHPSLVSRSALHQGLELEVIQVWSPLTPCCPLSSALSSALLSNAAHQHSCLSAPALWRIGRQIPRSSLLICQSVNKTRSSWTDLQDFRAFDLTPP